MPGLASRRFLGRRVLVTGAASGIGLELCRQLLSQGASVVGLDRDAKMLTSTWGSELFTVVADVGDSDAVQSAVTQACETLGGLDGVVNSAGC